MSTDIIALCGYATAGKDAFCRALQETSDAKRYAFADALKEEVAAKLHTTILHINSDKELFRTLLQSHGEARRKEDADYWIEQVAQKIFHEHPRIAILTDCRYRNEAQWVRGCGGVLVRVHRPGVGPVNGHESESDLATVLSDYFVLNDGTLGNLSDRASLFWGWWEQRHGG